MPGRTSSEPQIAREQPAHTPLRDEVSLVDIWRTLARRKTVVLVTFLGALATAATLTFLPKPVYEGRAAVGIGKVEIAKVMGSVPSTIEDPTVVLRWVKEEYRLEDRDQPKNYPRLDSVEHQATSGQSIVLLKARDHSPDGAQRFVAGVANRIIERHRVLYDEARNAQAMRVRELDADIRALQSQAELLQDMTKRLEDRAQAAIVAVERGNLLGTLARLRNERMSLGLSISAVQSYPTRLIHEPALPEDPVRPRPVLYFSLGGTLGLMLGIFGALFLEFLSKVRRRDD